MRTSKNQRLAKRRRMFDRGNLRKEQAQLCKTWKEQQKQLKSDRASYERQRATAGAAFEKFVPGDIVDIDVRRAFEAEHRRLAPWFGDHHDTVMFGVRVNSVNRYYMRVNWPGGAELFFHSGDGIVVTRSRRTPLGWLESVQARDRQAAAAKQRAVDLCLESVVLEKRSLLASGTVPTDTSRQGILAMEHPTAEERATLVRTLKRAGTGTDKVEPEQEQPEQVEAEPQPEPWPTHQDQTLIKLAMDKLEQGDVCAALMLVKWALATFDDSKHSLTYQKPKLAAKVAQLQHRANKWQVKHAAYLPLLRDPLSQGEDKNDVGLAIAKRKLALAMSLLPLSDFRASHPRLGTCSPLAQFLDYDLLRRAALLHYDYDVRAYMKRVGLGAWYFYFENYLPANIKSVRLVRATTSADLERMAAKANMWLDTVTTTKVLNAMKKA